LGRFPDIASNADNDFQKRRPAGNPTILPACNQEWNDPIFLKTFG
jgi:hypothetical protein